MVAREQKAVGIDAILRDDRAVGEREVGVVLVPVRLALVGLLRDDQQPALLVHKHIPGRCGGGRGSREGHG